MAGLGMVGVDPRDPATEASKGHFYRDYTRFLDPHGLEGARIGVWREGVFGFSPEGDAVANEAIAMLGDLGATVVDPTDIPHVSDVFGPEFTVLLFDFKHDLNLYLEGLVSSPVRSLKELIAFDIAHADVLLIVGSNPAETLPPAMQFFDEGRARGAKHIVVDPRRTDRGVAKDRTRCAVHLPRSIREGDR